jgi:transcriptional regulator with XRE-family HTH domain
MVEDMDINRTFGLAVRHARLAMKISQEELGFRANLHRTYIGDVERGVRNVTLRSAERIAKALNTTMSELLGCKS